MYPKVMVTVILGCVDYEEHQVLAVVDSPEAGCVWMSKYEETHPDHDYDYLTYREVEYVKSPA